MAEDTDTDTKLELEHLPTNVVQPQSQSQPQPQPAVATAAEDPQSNAVAAQNRRNRAVDAAEVESAGAGPQEPPDEYPGLLRRTAIVTGVVFALFTVGLDLVRQQLPIEPPPQFFILLTSQLQRADHSRDCSPQDHRPVQGYRSGGMVWIRLFHHLGLLPPDMVRATLSAIWIRDPKVNNQTTD